MPKIILSMLLIAYCLYAEKKENNSEYIFTEGTGKVEVMPDYIVMRIGVSTIDRNLDSAIYATNYITDTIISILRKYKVEDKNIETYSSELVREYENNRDTTTYLGIKSEHILKVKYNDVNNVEKILNTMIGKGMNVLDYYEFGSSKEDSLKRIAAQIAYVESFKNAKAIADKSDRKLGRLLNTSFEKPEDYSIRPDFRIELSRKLIGGLMGGSDGGEPILRTRQDLKYLRIIVPLLHYENTVYSKYELK
jgi:uncharacterized protein YggE